MSKPVEDQIEYYELSRSELQQSIGYLQRARQHLSAAVRNLGQNERTQMMSREIGYLDGTISTLVTLLDIFEAQVPRFIRRGEGL